MGPPNEVAVAEDSDIAAVDSAIKLIISPDQRVGADAADPVEEVTRRRIQKAFFVRRGAQGSVVCSGGRGTPPSDLV
ncbi:Retrovirus-related Pol polyprotein from type-2 retrotransposable element R2DM [Aphis craccivora]|uniref:Retrovirus-related Pol polyprotein from type-2 retrotransposable element R2DM n=1 Tax=Aphis craccivora TaxID=307492 RepID=A0A6G0XZ74_APHCR|nr:Retrovirus-related Pol polyprotein from type-2 retrotransposable element R2DM [Aphis craccivora]